LPVCLHLRCTYVAAFVTPVYVDFTVTYICGYVVDLRCLRCLRFTFILRYVALLLIWLIWLIGYVVTLRCWFYVYVAGCCYALLFTFTRCCLICVVVVPVVALRYPRCYTRCPFTFVVVRVVWLLRLVTPFAFCCCYVVTLPVAVLRCLRYVVDLLLLLLLPLLRCTLHVVIYVYVAFALRLRCYVYVCGYVYVYVVVDLRLRCYVYVYVAFTLCTLRCWLHVPVVVAFPFYVVRLRLDLLLICVVCCTLLLICCCTLLVTPLRCCCCCTLRLLFAPRVPTLLLLRLICYTLIYVVVGCRLRLICWFTLLLIYDVAGCGYVCCTVAWLLRLRCYVCVALLPLPARCYVVVVDLRLLDFTLRCCYVCYVYVVWFVTFVTFTLLLLFVVDCVVVGALRLRCWLDLPTYVALRLRLVAPVTRLVAPRCLVVGYRLHVVDTFDCTFPLLRLVTLICPVYCVDLVTLFILVTFGYRVCCYPRLRFVPRCVTFAGCRLRCVDLVTLRWFVVVELPRYVPLPRVVVVTLPHAGWFCYGCLRCYLPGYAFYPFTFSRYVAPHLVGYVCRLIAFTTHVTRLRLVTVGYVDCCPVGYVALLRLLPVCCRLRCCWLRCVVTLVDFALLVGLLLRCYIWTLRDFAPFRCCCVVTLTLLLLLVTLPFTLLFTLRWLRWLLRLPFVDYVCCCCTRCPVVTLLPLRCYVVVAVRYVVVCCYTRCTFVVTFCWLLLLRVTLLLRYVTLLVVVPRYGCYARCYVIYTRSFTLRCYVTLLFCPAFVVCYLTLRWLDGYPAFATLLLPRVLRYGLRWLLLRLPVTLVSGVCCYCSGHLLLCPRLLRCYVVWRLPFQLRCVHDVVGCTVVLFIAWLWTLPLLLLFDLPVVGCWFDCCWLTFLLTRCTIVVALLTLLLPLLRLRCVIVVYWRCPLTLRCQRLRLFGRFGCSRLFTLLLTFGWTFVPLDRVYLLCCVTLPVYLTVVPFPPLLYYPRSPVYPRLTLTTFYGWTLTFDAFDTVDVAALLFVWLRCAFNYVAIRLPACPLPAVALWRAFV